MFAGINDFFLGQVSHITFEVEIIKKLLAVRGPLALPIPAPKSTNTMAEPDSPCNGDNAAMR